MLTADLHALLARLAQGPGVLVSVAGLRGSGPREPGAWMAVFADTCIGTVGGGHLEFEAIAAARALLEQPQPLAFTRTYALGPTLGQCCGGSTDLHFEVISETDGHRLRDRLGTPLQPVALFGAGHVGSAIVQALAPLPFALTWIDSRDAIFPEPLPLHAAAEHSDPVQSAVPQLAAGSLVLIMSFSHAEDLDVLAACLKRRRERGDLPWVGLIGSRTKWAVFRQRLVARGFTEDELAGVTCPIGLPGITGKEPPVIAASVAAQLLQLRNEQKQQSDR